MPLFYHSWQEVCPKFGMTMSEDAFYSFAGVPLPDIVKTMHRRQLGAEASADFVAEFLAAKKRLHAANEGRLGHPKQIECVCAIAREAKRLGIPIAVATSGLRDHVAAHLAAAGLDDLFSFELGNVVTAADVAAGKPAPDIFIEAARRIGLDPRACRAFEDGESGLESAYAAGCEVIDVTQMGAYPGCAGLSRAKREAARTRTWLGQQADDAEEQGRCRRIAMVAMAAAAGVALMAALAARRTCK